MKKKLLFTSLIACASLIFCACNPTTKSSAVPSSNNNGTSLKTTSSSNKTTTSSSSAKTSVAINSSSPSSKPNSSSSVISSSVNNNRPESVKLDIFAFNDTHGVVKDTQGKGIGISKMTTFIKEKTQNKNSIIISQGDMWQGSIESNYTRGNLVTEWMNQLNFVSMTVGNHEYDWGKEYIIQNQQLANFPTLGINVLNKTTNTRVDYLSPSVTFTRGEAKIGVIGAIGNCLSSISGSKVQDIYFAKGDALSRLVKQESQRLKNEEHCDFIIYSIHGAGDRDEGDSYDISLSNDHYVDLVLEGHTHQGYSYKDDGNVYHIQNYGYNQTVSQISVDLNLKNSTYIVEEPISYDTSYSGPYSTLASDAETEALFTKYHDKYDFAYQELGKIDSFKNANVIRQKVADLYLEKGAAKWGNQYNVILGGGFLSCRGSGLDAGSVTYAQLDDLLPFDNDIVLCSVSGYNLKNSQFVTGASNYFVTWSEYGTSIKDSLDDTATYYLVTDTYSSDYTYNHLTVIDTLAKEKYARDLLADFIKAGGWAPVTPTEHAGTIQDPKTIAEALEYAREHVGASAAAAGSEEFVYKGVVTRQAYSLSDISGDLNNVYVADSIGGEEMQIYYISRNKNKAPNWSSKEDLKVGDVIVFAGKAFYYNSRYLQFASGSYCIAINGVSTN